MAKKDKDLLVVDDGNLPAYLKGMEEDTRGNEHVGKDDLVIPRLNLIQALSPEIKKNDPMFIKGAEQGQLINTVTKEIYGESVIIVPVIYEKFWLLWKDRKKGGGFGGQFDTMEEATLEIDSLENPDEWEAIDTPTHLCLIIHNNKATEIAIPMPKSKAKVSRQWNSLIRMLEGPRFGRAYKISGIEDQNAAGEDYWNFKIEQSGFPSEKVFKAAEALYEEIASGEKKYKMDGDDIESTSEMGDMPDGF